VPTPARLFRTALLPALLLLPAAAADACPVCQSETGKQVRAGIFNADFGSNLLAISLPFPVLLGVAAALHFGFRPREGATDAIPPDLSTHPRP
jgi:hypothetical protein